MSLKRTFPAPLTVLMIVIVIAAIATCILPAGKYNTLSYKDRNSFIIETTDGEVQVPFTQKTVDSLGLHISLKSFEEGDIRNPVSWSDKDIHF